MSAASFHQTTGRILRAEDLGNGRRGALVEVIAALPITPLWPLSAATIAETETNSPRESKETYHALTGGEALPNVLEGDTIEVDSRQYRISHVAEWPDRDLPTLRLVVEEIKF